MKTILSIAIMIAIFTGVVIYAGSTLNSAIAATLATALNHP